MFDWLFSLLLRLPTFRGKGRLLRVFRGKLRWTYVQPIYHGLLMRIHPAEWAQFELLLGHILEKRTLSLYSQLLKPGDTYVDIGAHLGFHSLVARHCVGAGGHILAVEPQPYNCDSILENARLNGFGNITVQVGAVGSEAGFVNLALQPTRDRSVLSLLDGVTAEKADVTVSFRVPVLPLEAVLTQNWTGRVKLLKIDVEGYEAAVLDGAKAIAANIDNIILEILPPPLTRSDSRLVYARLIQMGFTVWRTVEGVTVKADEPMPDNNLWASRPEASAK
jgi:FkbM family methyltransferase